MNCPVCGSEDLESYRDQCEWGTLEAEHECRSCRMWFYTFAYGNTAERVGFVYADWGYRDDPPRLRDAVDEARRMRADPEWNAMRRAPLAVLADWLGDRGFVTQEAALRSQETR